MNSQQELELTHNSFKQNNLLWAQTATIDAFFINNGIAPNGGAEDLKLHFTQIAQEGLEWVMENTSPSSLEFKFIESFKEDDHADLTVLISETGEVWIPKTKTQNQSKGELIKWVHRNILGHLESLLCGPPVFAEGTPKEYVGHILLSHLTDQIDNKYYYCRKSLGDELVVDMIDIALPKAEKSAQDFMELIGNPELKQKGCWEVKRYEEGRAINIVKKQELVS